MKQKKLVLNNEYQQDAIRLFEFITEKTFEGE
jgi:hypothetical protein